MDPGPSSTSFRTGYRYDHNWVKHPRSLLKKRNPSFSSLIWNARLAVIHIYSDLFREILSQKGPCPGFVIAMSTLTYKKFTPVRNASDRIDFL